MGDIQQVTPEIEVPDSAFGFNHNSNLSFVIGGFTIQVVWEKPYDLLPDMEWRFTTSISGWVNMSELNDAEDQPTARMAQEFLCETLLKGILEEKVLEVTCP
jgi:hypothetical protein